MSDHLQVKNAPGRIVHIINPGAGSKNDGKIKETVGKAGGEILNIGDTRVREAVCDLFSKDPFAHAVVYGGDGTVFETVNGIFDSGAEKTATFSVVPTGSGNDFSTYVNDSGEFPRRELVKIDVVKTVSGEVTRYFANMMNVGFDCAVVEETLRLKDKPLFSGKNGYLAAAFKVMLQKKTTALDITFKDFYDIKTGEIIPETDFSKKVLLCAVANGKFCGGGFKAAPLSSLNDSFSDVVIANDVSRRKFISIIGNYRKGNYISDKGELLRSFKDVIDYRRCRKMTIVGAETFCLDGEIFKTGEDKKIDVETIHCALGYIPL